MQQLPQPLTNGNNMIMRVKYFPDSALTDKIELYDSAMVVKTLRDDGVYPDSVAGDYNYAMCLTENIAGFKAEIAALEAQMLADGGVYHFEGHSGQFISNIQIPQFDFTAFDHFVQVQVYQPILDVTQCESSILKQNSLFITELSVVEDQARTYNVHSNTGNPLGAWTFGFLIKEMANTPVTGITARDFLKEWVRNWTIDQSVGSFANGAFPNVSAYQNVLRREKVFMHLIGPWLNKANGTSTVINENNWESIWDNTNQYNLLVKAPFKLMAIVNRIDLRGNTVYNATVQNAGEVRFIFTLIDPTTGKPPVHDDPFLSTFTIPDGAIDWIGMNVILEYGIPITDKCALRDFAMQWYDLSAFPLGSVNNPNPQFNDHLQMITDQIVLKGLGGNKNLNKSAINQVRTNEKIFQKTPPGANSVPNWEVPDWELRQFELDEDGYLAPAVVTNTPVDERNGNSFNRTPNLSISASNNSVSSSPALEQWIYGANGNSINRIRVSKGSHNLPEAFLAGSAGLYKEMSHHFGIDWNAVGPTLDTTVPDLLAKKIRHQLSLNTCQGCHGGETKTNFTQVYPRGYGEEANYWDPIPSYVNSSPFVGQGSQTSIDNRFYNTLKNSGHTYEMTTSMLVDNLEFSTQTSNTRNQIVSPFLTGRRYSSLGNGWEDDEVNNNPQLGGEGLVGSNSTTSDEKLTGVYFVNDPGNEAIAPTLGQNPSAIGNFPQLHTKRWGHNDLQRRQADLCDFVNEPCSGLIGSGSSSSSLGIMRKIAFNPFPKGAH